jgi:hypothetical protein
MFIRTSSHLGLLDALSIAGPRIEHLVIPTSFDTNVGNYCFRTVSTACINGVFGFLMQ